ncbi:Beta-glucosidase 24 [Linum grandiflorum]
MALAIVVVMMIVLARASSSFHELGILAQDIGPIVPTTDPCANLNYVYQPTYELPNGRSHFPHNFIFGTSASSYQVEGARDFTYGKGPSVWDKFAHDFPDRILGGGNGDVALDHYHSFMVYVAFIIPPTS